MADEEEPEHLKRDAEQSDVPEIEKSAGKDGMTLKDWVSMVVSLTALLLACISSYFTLLRQSDRLSLVIDGTPATIIDITTKELIINNVAGSMTFINTGSRPIAILAAVYEVFTKRKTEEKLETCEETGVGSERGVPYVWSPFTIGAGQIVIRDTKLDVERMTKVVDGQIYRQMPMREPAIEHNDIETLECIAFSIATPGYFNRYVYVPINRVTWKTVPRDASKPAFQLQSLLPIGKPTVLLDHKFTIFSE